MDLNDFFHTRNNNLKQKEQNKIKQEEQGVAKSQAYQKST
jgi:hypothetical protein